MNSGAEAVETAIKAARKWGTLHKGVPEGQGEIVVFTDNFHGRTTTVVSFSTEAQYRAGFGPFTPGFVIVPYGDADAVERAITPNTVAVFAEPIQGEAGIIVPPAGFLRRLREICDRHDALLILDEIQTGLGRTGKMFAFEHENIRPDAVTIGKALSGGFYPVSAFLASDAIMGVFNPGDHGSTFGGNPLGCAAAHAALDVLVDEQLPERASELGAWFVTSLADRRLPKIREIRGRGLMIGVELYDSAGKARPYVERLMTAGLLCKDTHGQTIRFAPPLVITAADLEWALEQFASILK
jgi:ornithine--oxo-acid transaminase